MWDFAIYVINLKKQYNMNLRSSQATNGSSGAYISPLVEIIEVKIEQGFAASNGGNESWNEIPGGGDF